MNVKKKPVRNNQLKVQLKKELSFVKNLFTRFSLPLQKKGENDDQMDIEITNETKQGEEKQLPDRAQSIIELEEKLEKIKSQNNFNLKTKLAKKSLTSKLHKKIKKRERVKLNKHKVKAALDSSEIKDVIEVKEKKIKLKEKNVNTPKPIFNTEGKLVFSKFDFAKLGENDRGDRSHKDPRKLLENLKQQEEKLQRLAEVDSEKAKELKEKAAWKNILQKAEGEKVKDDPTLLKKSIKKMEQKKKVSQKKWEGRIQNVEKKKEERQSKRKENISKKKKEKKAKVVKAAVKRDPDSNGVKPEALPASAPGTSTPMLTMQCTSPDGCVLPTYDLVCIDRSFSQISRMQTSNYNPCYEEAAALPTAVVPRDLGLPTSLQPAAVEQSTYFD